MKVSALALICLFFATLDDAAFEPQINIPLCNVCDERGITDPILGADVAGFATVREVEELGRGRIRLKVEITASLRNAARLPKITEVLELKTEDHGKKFPVGDEVLLLGHTTSRAIYWHFPYSIGPKGKIDVQFAFDHPIANAMRAEEVERWLALALDQDRPLCIWAASKLQQQSGDFWTLRQQLINYEQFQAKISGLPLDDPQSMMLCRIAVMSGNPAFAEFVQVRYRSLEEANIPIFPNDLMVACLIAGGENALSDFEARFFGSIGVPNEIHHWDSEGGRLLRAIVTLHECGQGRFSTTRTGQSISRLLDERAAADLAITALREIKCWDHVEQISQLWMKGGFTSRTIENAIIRYVAACRDDEQTTDKIAVQFASDWLERVNEETPELILRALR